MGPRCSKGIINILQEPPEAVAVAKREVKRKLKKDKTQILKPRKVQTRELGKNSKISGKIKKRQKAKRSRENNGNMKAGGLKKRDGPNQGKSEKKKGHKKAEKKIVPKKKSKINNKNRKDDKKTGHMEKSQINNRKRGNKKQRNKKKSKINNKRTDNKKKTGDSFPRVRNSDECYEHFMAYTLGTKKLTTVLKQVKRNRAQFHFVCESSFAPPIKSRQSSKKMIISNCCVMCPKFDFLFHSCSIVFFTA